MIHFLIAMLISSSGLAKFNGSLETIVSLRDEYLTIAEKSGLKLGFIPEIREWTRPSMISWRAETKAVAIPKWDELSKDQRGLVNKMAGSPEKARELFQLLFRWFLVPHELTHAYQDQQELKIRPSDNERFANDVAVAFLHQNKQNLERLIKLEKLLKSAEENLKAASPEKLSDDFFNSYYQEFPKSNMPLYARYQIRFMLDSLKKRKTLNLDNLFMQLKSSPNTK